MGFAARESKMLNVFRESAMIITCNHPEKLEDTGDRTKLQSQAQNNAFVVF